MQLYFYEMCLNQLEDPIEVLSVAQFCLIHCDLRAGGHSINSQGSPLVPASPGLWQCCSCLCLCVCVCMWGCPSSLYYAYMTCVYLSKCECWDSCLHGALWRQGAEGCVSCDLDNRWHPPPGVPLCKPETLSIGTPIYVCYRTKNTPCLFTNVSFEKKKVVIFKWRVTGNSGNIQQTLMTCNKWFSQPGIEPGTNCSGLFYNLNDICI